jgi:phosphohistidine phosphatase SixA
MHIWVVRHACAGRKDRFPGPDEARPLDEWGRRQARAIARRLASAGAPRLRASSTRRCIDTLIPLADRLDLPIEPWDELRVDGYPGGLLHLLDDTAEGGEVICTHGEVMRPALDQLRGRGATIVGAPDDLLAKGAIWQLDLDAGTVTLHDADERLVDRASAGGARLTTRWP